MSRENEIKEEAGKYWNHYRELGIEPSVQVYAGIQDNEYEHKGFDGLGLTIAEKAFSEFKDNWVCPYCGKDPEMGRKYRGAPHVMSFRTRYHRSGAGEWPDDGFRVFRAHLAIWHPEENKMRVDRAKSEYWDDVRALLLSEDAISHETWTRELQFLWKAIHEIQLQSAGKKKGV